MIILPSVSSGITSNSLFKPTNISNLDLWLDASDGNTLYDATSGGNLVTTDGSTVKRWEDKSGNSNHATESTNAPTLSTNAKNSLNALNFATSKYCTCSFASKTFTQQTVFLVLQFSTSTANFGRAFTQTISGSQDFAISGHYIPLLRNSTTNQIGSYAGGAPQSTVATANQVWYIARARHSGSALTVSLNGISGISASHTLNRNFNLYRIGAHNIGGDTAYWNSIISEVIVYTRNLTDSESNLVTNYLNTKWAIY